MRFLITMTDIAGEWDRLSAERQADVLKQHEELKTALHRAGVWFQAIHLYPRDEAVTVRLDEAGNQTVANGPYNDALEYPGGYYLIDVESAEDAIRWAEQARFMTGANEIRRVWE